MGKSEGRGSPNQQQFDAVQYQEPNEQRNNQGH